MNAAPSLILLEFNELCPALMEKFIKAGQLPHFKRLWEESEIYTTDAEEEGENLNPWVQWVTVHSGLEASEHKVRTLSEGPLLKEKAVWDLLSDAGFKSWVCGSMNPRCDLPLNGYLLPDPWSEGIDPEPVGEFEAYNAYIRSAVQEHTNPDGKGRGSLRSFLFYMLTHGLSFRTFAATIRQLASERFADTRWKRAAVMDQFQWDIFRHYYKKYRPAFSTFFLNSTAHLQHCFWRDMEPEKFQSAPDEKKQEGLRDAILFGYKKMDKLINRFIKLAGRHTTLMFSTALSQQPYLDHEGAGGRHYYRVKTDKILVDHLGIAPGFSYEPLMAEQFHLRFKSEDDAARAESQLCSYHVKDARVFEDNRTRLFHLVRKGDTMIVQCRCTRSVPGDVVISAEDGSKQISFFDVFYQLDTVKSAKHHPDGMLWVRHPDRRHIVHKEKVTIRAIAPTILELFQVAIPQYMKADPLTMGAAQRALA